jgi:hypothetical protein
LNVRLDDNSLNSPAAWCFVATTGGSVVSQPSASPTQPGLVYYGDGTLLEATDVSVPGSGCDPESSVTVSGSQPVVAGPIAFPCASACGNTADEVYAVVSDNSSSRLVRYTYGNSTLRQVTPDLSLPWANVSGISVSAATLPAEVAISFRGGVALVQLDAKGGMWPAASAAIAAGVSDAPYWCHCPSGDLIGLGAQDGGLYLYNRALVPQPGFPAGGALISTTPGVDAAGNWYFGAADGYVHEVQLQPGQTSMTQVESYGPVGQVTSSVQVAGCPQGICVYLGTLNNHAYLVPLDARKAVISACITTSPPTCSGANPRLWASVEVGAIAGPQTVHVQGWSYYSG